MNSCGLIFYGTFEDKSIESTGSEIMIFSPSRAKTVRVMGKSTSYSDSTSKNTFKKFISLIKRRWFGLQLQI